MTWYQSIYNKLLPKKKVGTAPAGTDIPTLHDNLNVAKVIFRTGKSEEQLLGLAYYYGISLIDLVDYYLFFERFPDEDNILIIQHWGVPALIQEIVDNMADLPTNTD